MGTKCSQQDVWDGKSQSWARTCSQGWATSTSQDPAPGVLGCHGVWMAFGSHAERHRVLGAKVSQECPPITLGAAAAALRPLPAGGSGLPGLCSGCLWGFSLLPVLRQLSSLLREE